MAYRELQAMAFMKLVMNRSLLKYADPLHFPDDDYKRAVIAMKKGDPAPAMHLVRKLGGGFAEDVHRAVIKGLTEKSRLVHKREHAKAMRFCADGRMEALAKKHLQLSEQLEGLCDTW